MEEGVLLLDPPVPKRDPTPVFKRGASPSLHLASRNGVGERKIPRRRSYDFGDQPDGEISGQESCAYLFFPFLLHFLLSTGGCKKQRPKLFFFFFKG